MSIEKKFKDRNPLETISYGQQFAESKGLLPVEKWTENPGLYSVSLSFPGTSFHVNGKGASHAFALASAYGEFMERFQNKVFIRMRSKAIEQIVSDEDKVENTVEAQSEFIRALQKEISFHREIKLPSESLKKYMNLVCGKQIACCTLQNVSTAEPLTIPYALLDYYYGTNGMVAGNTKAEAFVEGLSEILERYAVKQFMSMKYTPPFLDAEVLSNLKNYKNITGYIQNIEHSGKYRIEIRDLSMGGSIPAVGIILYCSENSSYLVKVGAHPSLEIALERCFTELLQGQYIDKYTNMIRVSSSANEVQKEINLHNFYVNGRGAFPAQFFQKKGSFPSAKQWPSYQTNDEMMYYLIKLIEKLGYKIYVHDSTSSNIAAYQFVIPGMSEHISFSEQTLKNLIEDIEISNLIRKGACHFDTSKAELVSKYLDICGYDKAMPISALITELKLYPNNIYTATSIYVFQIRLLMFLEQYEPALKVVQAFNCYLQNRQIAHPFYLCLEDYLSLIKSNSTEEIRQILLHFYKSGVIEQIINFKSNMWLKDFHEISCDFYCEKCKCKNICLTRKDLEIYKNLLRFGLNE